MKAIRQGGFTLVEMMVTVIVGALFIIAITHIYIIQSRLSSTLVAYNNANLLAYNNLRTFAYGKSPSWFECDYSGGSPLAMTLLQSTDPAEGIPPPVSQNVTATAPYGCGGSSSALGYPIRVVSTVTYGSDGKVVVHATYSTY